MITMSSRLQTRDSIKERPIPLRAHEVRGIIHGRQTQTRRIVKPQPPSLRGQKTPWASVEDMLAVCPYGKPGDRLWARETFAIETNAHIGDAIDYPPPFSDGRPVKWSEDLIDWEQCHYRATDPMPELFYEDDGAEPKCRWTPSIHMPRWAFRITLEITGVRVERLQGISEADCIAEGLESLPPAFDHGWMCAAPVSGGWGHPVLCYRELWESINGPGSWDANPWVWCLSFRRIAP